MAKKTESKQNEQTVTPAVQEEKTAVSENVPEKTESVPEPQETAAGTVESMKSMDEIFNNDTELDESFAGSTDKETLPEKEQQAEPEEKILFYIKTVHNKTAVRSTPEYPMTGNSNVIDIITGRGPYGITDEVNGFGRIAGGTGWIMLDPSVVTRQ